MSYTALYGNLDSKLRDKSGNPITGWCVRNDRQDQTSWVDFNGDGKIDMICDNIDGGHDLYLSRGTYMSNVNDGSGSTRIVGPGWCIRKNGRIDTTSWSDLNRDGKMDIICNNVDGGRDYLLSAGTYVRPAYAQEIQSLNFSYIIGQPASLHNDEVPALDSSILCSKDNPIIHQIRLVDFNGDGLKDLVCDAIDGSHYVYLYEETNAPMTVISTGITSTLIPNIPPIVNQCKISVGTCTNDFSNAVINAPITISQNCKSSIICLYNSEGNIVVTPGVEKYEIYGFDRGKNALDVTGFSCFYKSFEKTCDNNRICSTGFSFAKQGIEGISEIIFSNTIGKLDASNFIGDAINQACGSSPSSNSVTIEPGIALLGISFLIALELLW